jgi:hypothetical protein
VALLGQIRVHDTAAAFQWLSAGPEIYARIAEIYAQPSATIFLRAADALYLATAAQTGFRHRQRQMFPGGVLPHNSGLPTMPQ